MPAPIAFMVMPFGRKATGLTEKEVPADVDFDALWERVYQPILEERGYKAVRADRDAGALIISEMIQRLAIADLVVADITIANANVFYEVGVRHAAKERGCVLVGAEWARPVFDLAQMRAVRFPLADGDVSGATADRARDTLRDGIAGLADGLSPVFSAVPGFPDPDAERATAFADAVAELSEFEAEIRAVRAAPDAQREDRARELTARFGNRPAVRELVWIELLPLVRDVLGFPALLDYIEALPHNVAKHPLVLEQRALALSKTGDNPGAIGQLEELIATHGETSERYGLLGGRYKDLFSDAQEPRERRKYLRRAIEAYERGMEVDLNDFYPASNLPRLYRERNDPGDDQLAVEAAVAAKVACRAAIENGTTNEWVRPTLLGIAFDQSDVPEAIRLRPLIENDGPERWKLARTIDDLRTSVRNQPDPEVQAALQAVLDQLEELL
jgi:tetratricopeptide (TPR) repeat protein